MLARGDLRRGPVDTPDPRAGFGSIGISLGEALLEPVGCEIVGDLLVPLDRLITFEGSSYHDAAPPANGIDRSFLDTISRDVGEVDDGPGTSGEMLSVNGLDLGRDSRGQGAEYVGRLRRASAPSPRAVPEDR